MSEADPRFKIRTYLNQAPYFPTMLVVEGDAHLSKLDLHEFPVEGAFGYVVDGNLHVDEAIESWDEEAMTLLVTGDVRAGGLIACGAEMVVLGSLYCESYLIGYYNHGQVRVEGDLHATYLLNSDHDIHWAGAFHGEGAYVFGNDRLPALNRSKDDLLAELLNEDGLLDVERAVSHIRGGKSPFRS